MAEDDELELLLDLDGASYEAAAGYIVTISAKRVPSTKQRPHGIVYSLVLRPKAGGKPFVRFDNAHSVPHPGARHAPRRRPMIIGTGARTILAGPTPSPAPASCSKISGGR